MLAQFKKQPLLGILRGVTEEKLPSLIETVISAGLKTLEITMNTPDAPKLIRQAKELSQGRLDLGAGTVLTLKDLEQALSAGASFIVSPVMVEEVISACVSKKVPVFPGALTPNEIYRAWLLGASMVKVFPSNFFGPEYFKEVRGPFKDIQLMACGGVTAENLPEYFSSGANAVSFGGSVFKKDFPGIKQDIEQLLTALKKSQLG